MKSKQRILIGALILSLLLLSGITAPLLKDVKSSKTKNETGKTVSKDKDNTDNPTQVPSQKKRSKFKEIDKHLLEHQLNSSTSKSQKLSLQGETWQKDPGDWWDTDWEYRKNVTINGEVPRSSWPVDVFIKFTPPAHYYSLRVIDSAYNEIPYQPWNISYVNSSYIDAATVSFMVDLSSGGPLYFQIYWSTSDKPLPIGDYTNKINILTASTPDGTRYTISSTIGWSITLSPYKGGTAKNFTHQSGQSIGHSDWLNFGISRDTTTSYEDYWGTGNTHNLQYDWRGLIESQDPLANQYKGIIFTTYKVSNVELYSESKGTLAKVNYTYRFYEWGWTTQETIKWEQSDTSDYLMNGWVFDQDNGGTEEGRFSHVTTNSETRELLSILKSQSGSITQSWSDHRLMWNGYPVLRSHRYYIDSTGSHSIDISGVGWDDPGAYVYDPNGNFVDGDWAYNGLSFSFSASTTGYFYILVYCWGEDTDDGRMGYDLYVDGNLIADEYYVGMSNGAEGDYVPDRDAIRLHDWDASAIGETVVSELSFDAGDFDFFLFHGDGTLKSKQTTTNNPESSTFTPTAGGHWTILIHKFQGSTSSGYTHTIYQTGEVKDFTGTGTAVNYTAFFDNDEGIGRVWIDEDNGSVSISEDQWIWFNEGDDSEEDYLLWGRNVSLTAAYEQTMRCKYAVIPWTPSGATPTDRLGEFNDTRDSLWSSITHPTSSRERFKLKVSVNVEDSDDRGMGGVHVGFKDSHIATEETYNISGTTSSAGSITFDVERVWYNITANLTSAGHTYYINSIHDFSDIKYTDPKEPVTLDFSYLVKVGIQAQTNVTPVSDIQGGLIRFNNTTDSPEWNLTSSTNLTGWIDVFIPTDSWDLTMNATTHQAGWDYFTLYNFSTGEIIAGADSVRSFTLQLTTRVIYRLEDVNITAPSPEAELTWYQAPDANPYWGENISGMVILRDEDNKTSLTGNVTWQIRNPLGTPIKSKEGQTTPTGNYSFEINVSSLHAGKTYSLEVSAVPGDGDYNLPTPLERTITVDRVPTSISVSLTWGASGSYWDESLEVRVSYTNELKDQGVPHAAVEGVFIKGGSSPHTYKNDSWDTVALGEFKLTFLHFRQYGAGSYSLKLNASRGNFTAAEAVKTLIVHERPTTLDMPSYLETPWTNNFTFYAKYYDELYEEPVTDRTYTRKNLSDVTYVTIVSFKLTDQNDSVIKSGEMKYWSENGLYNYTLKINGSALTEGTYTVTVSADKLAFESQTLRTTFQITERSTTLTADPPRIEATYTHGFSVRFDYNDTSYSSSPFGEGSYVVGASEKSCTISGPEEFVPIHRTLTDQGNGSYLLSMSTKTLNWTGTFKISVNIQKPHYERQTKQITLIVEEVPTTTSVTKKETTVYWGKTVNISINWTNTANGTLITNAENKSWYHRKSSLNGNLTLANGTYRFVLNTSLLGQGSHIIDVYFEKPHRVSQHLTLSINVAPVPTVASVTKREINTYWGIVETVNASYYRSSEYNGSQTPISSADAAYYTISGTNISEAAAPIGEGLYTLTINTTKLGLSSYVLTLYLEEGYHTGQTIAITLTIRGTPTEVTATSRKLHLYWGQNAEVNATWRYSRSTLYAGEEGPVTGARNRTYRVWNGSELVFQGSLVEFGDGEYGLRFNTSEIGIGVFTLYMYLKKGYTENQTIVVSPFTVAEIPAIVQYPESKEVIWGDYAAFEITVINILTRGGITGVGRDVTTQNQTFSTNLTEIGNGTYLFNISTSELGEGRNALHFNLTKAKYEIPDFIVYLTVKSLIDSIQIRYEEIKTEVTLNPVTRGVSQEEKKITVSIYDVVNERALLDAQITYKVKGLGEGTFEAGTVSGTYVAHIDWSKAAAGKTYLLNVELVGLRLGGRQVSLAKNMRVAAETRAVSVDYYGGSTSVAGFRLPNVWFFTVIVAVLAVAVVGSIKLYTYLATPPEVRELLRLIEQVEQGELDYPLVTRDEQFERRIAERYA